VLDESMWVFRTHWLNFALVSVIALFPPGLVLIWLSATGVLYGSFTLAELQGGRLADPALVSAQLAQLGATFAYSIVSALFGLLWTTAIVLTTDAYLRGEEPKLSRVYGVAIRRYFVLLMSSLLFVLALFGLALVATVLFVVTIFGFLGSLIAIVGLLFWWLRRSSRRPWLRWLIIVATPYGLPVYFATRWGMYIAAVVLEDRMPVRALSRSSELTDRRWFRVFAILGIASLIIGTMLSVLGGLVTIPLTVFEAVRGQFGLNPTEAVISSAATFIIQVLLASIGSIVYTVLFIDLRNRREGTDIVERLSQLEASPLPANG
jgi:hypothetical protein